MRLQFFLYLLALGCMLWCITAGVLAGKNMPRSFRLLIIQAVLAAVTITIGVTYQLKAENNTVLFNLYMLPEFLLLFFAAQPLLQITHKRPYTVACIAVFVTVWLSCININGISTFANWALVIQCIIISVTYLILIVHTLQKDTGIPAKAFYFICFPIILYHCCDIPLFAAYNYLAEHDRVLLSKLFNINKILSLIRYFFIGVGFILFRKTPLTLQLS